MYISQELSEIDTSDDLTYVLLIEDDPGDAVLVRRALTRAYRGKYEVIHVDNLMAGVDYLRTVGNPCDVVLLDISLPDAQGLQGLSVLNEITQASIPVVILSGNEDEELAHSAILRDAQDYLSKQDMTEKALNRTLRYSIERHRAHLELRRSRERFRQFARVASDRFWEMDAEFRFSDAIGTLTDEHRPHREDVIGKRRWELSGYAPVPPLTWEAHREDLENHRPFREFEVSYTDSNGKVTYWSINGEPMLNEVGDFLGYRGTAANITKQKEAEQVLRSVAEELAAATKELAESNAKKDKFFSIIAHDLRSPFAAMLGAADMFRRGIAGKDPEKFIEQGDMMYAAATRALNLVEDLLEWSRLQLGGVSFDPESFDIVEMVKETIDLTSDQAGQKNVSLALTPSPPVSVCADKRAISSVVRNLLGNAVKFTGDGGHVAVEIRDASSVVEVCVRDTGVGMDEDKIDKLFEISEEKSTSGTAGEKGTGLGLVLCKELIEQNSGRITVQSILGEGTTVMFTLPKGKT